MTPETKIVIATVASFSLIFSALGAGIVAVKRRQCLAGYADSGLAVRWDFWAGCRVDVPGQGWIPARNYRVL